MPITAEEKVMRGDLVATLRDWAKGKFHVNKYTISLLSASWTGSASPYTQTVSVTGTTSKSKIDIQADNSVLAQMIIDGTKTIYIANNEGTLTAYAVGEKPTANLSLQVTRTELA